MANSKKTRVTFDSYDEFRKKKLTQREMNATDRTAQRQVAVLRSIQQAITREIEGYMRREEIGFNELTRRLETSSRQTNRILRGEANLTLGTLVEIALLMKKRPKILFE
jgi:hypothetical protein